MMTLGSKAQVTPKQHTKPCHDCPFRRNALPGWLAGMSPEEWMRHAHGETEMQCHALKKKRGAHYCAGAAIFRRNICKMVADPKAPRLEPDKVNVFSWDDEFIAHHKVAKAVEKQEPKPVIKVKGKAAPKTTHTVEYHCPDCGHYFEDKDWGEYVTCIECGEHNAAKTGEAA